MSDEYEHDPTLLTNYLCQAYLPPLVLDSNLPAVPQYAPPWQRIEELDMDRPRLLRLVSEIPLAALQNAIRLCKSKSSLQVPLRAPYTVTHN